MKDLILSEWLGTSLKFGALTGLVASAAYLGFFMALALVSAIENLFTSPAVNRPMPEPIANELFGFTLITIIGLLPSSIIGALTGLVIGLALWCVRRWDSPTLAAGIGVALCMGVVVWLARGWLAFIAMEPLSVDRIFWLGSPIIVYIAAGGIAGVRLNRQLHPRHRAGRVV